MSVRRPSWDPVAVLGRALGTLIAAGLVLLLGTGAMLPASGIDDVVTSRPASAMSAGASGGLGCRSTPTASPSVTPSRTPVGVTEHMTRRAAERAGREATPRPIPEPSREATPRPIPEPSPEAYRTIALAVDVDRSAWTPDADAVDAHGSVPTNDRAPGIDISRYDGAVDMRLVQAVGVRFVITKATQGSKGVDPWYGAHVTAAREADLALGSYHVFDYRRNGVAQADAFVDVMAANGALDGVLPPVVDVECLTSMGQADRSAARSRLRALVDRVYQRTGRLVMIYTSAHMWGQVTGNDTSFGAHPLWVACWSCQSPILPSGWTTWMFWQTGPLRVPGISRQFDGNVAAGDDQVVHGLRSRRMVVAGDAPLSTGGSLKIETRGTDGYQLRTSTRDDVWSEWRPRDSVHTVTLDGPDGDRTVRLQGRDTRGTLGPIVSDAIRLDATRPVVHAPRVGLRGGTVATGPMPIPVRVAWSVSDATSGIVSAQLRADCGGATFIAQDDASLHAAPNVRLAGSRDDRFASGTACVMGASAVDGAGNTTSVPDNGVRVHAVQDTPSARLRYSKGWKRSSFAAAFGGSVRSSRTIDRWVRLRFTGGEIALVASLGRDRGRVRIAIDGVRVATVDLRASITADRRIVFHQRLGSGSHTIEVRTMGTARKPRTGARVDIDGFLVIGP